MRRTIILLTAVALLGIVDAAGIAAEHGGKEHGGAAMPAQPSKDQIHDAMRAYITQQATLAGALAVDDPVTGKARKLELLRVHDRVGKTGNYYYSCADFKDLESGELLDLDLDVTDAGGALSVADVKIHKVNGKERYTYDANDNRIPVTTP